MDATGGARTPRRLPLVVFAVVGAGLLLAAALLDRSMREGARTRAGRELDAVAVLQAESIVRWREEHLRNVAYAASYPSVERAAAEIGRGRLEPDLAEHVSQILGHLGERHRYVRIALLDAAARPVAGWRDPAAPDHPFDRNLIDLALASGSEAVFQHHDHGDEDWSLLDVAVAVRPRGTSASVVALRVAMGTFLEPLLTGWPSAAVTASSALVRPSRDGAAAVVLGARHWAPGGGHTLIVPRSRTERPAVLAIGGARGVVLATDFAGTRVLATIRPVPGTDWLLVPKMDLSEIEAPLVRPALAIFALVAALLLAGGVLLAVWWREEARRARVEAALRESQERLRLALSSAFSIWDWDLARGTLVLEGPLLEVASRRAAGARGTLDQVLEQLVHPDDQAQAKVNLDAHLRGEAAEYVAEHRVITDDGSVRWVISRGRVVARDQAGRPARLLGVVTDVTERRAMQAQLERSERMAGLGTLAAGVAHEINNPLAALLADLEAVTRLAGPLGPEADGALADARDAAERVLDVARNLRAFARTGSGEKAPTEVQREIEAAVRIARNELRHRARLEVRLGPLPPVDAVHHELGQVFLNLLVNAAQAIPEGRAGEQTVTVEAATDAAGWARIEVRDTGAGIPRENLPRLFQPFFTTKPHGVGTGLGLAIANSIVSAAGGRIEVESQVGKGTTFRVLLPPSSSTATSTAASTSTSTATSTATATATAVPRGPGRRLRVLVVDDDPLVARAAVRTLGKRHDLTVSSTAAEALERLAGPEAFDAILCDLMMPQMTGMDLHARLEATRPEVARRMVFITGGAFTEGAAAFLRRPDVTWLEKPFVPEALRAAVERAAATPPPAR